MAMPSNPYVGFWRRTIAFMIDNTLMTMVMGIALVAMQAFAGDVVPMFESFRQFETLDVATSTFGPVRVVWGTTTPMADALVLAGFWLYSAVMESSSRQATIGKMTIGAVVTDTTGQRLSFGLATGRFLAKLVSGLLFMLGFLMVAFSWKKRGLHDRLAGTLVLNKGAAGDVATDAPDD